jgi:hypothetical protein
MVNTCIPYSCVSMKEIQTYEIGGGIQLQFSYKIPENAMCTRTHNVIMTSYTSF